MAKRNNAAQVQEQGANGPVSEDATEALGASSKAPKGFVDETVREIDGWYEPKVGVAVQGQLVGYLIIPSKKRGQADRQVALLELAHPIMAKKDDEMIRLEAGQTLGVGIRHQLKTMLDYVENRGEAWFKAVKKTPLPDGNDMWVFEQHYKGVKKPLVISKYARGQEQGDDSVPEQF